MKAADEDLLEQIFSPNYMQEPVFLFVYSAFCGTCHLARKIIEPLEATWDNSHFYDINASLYPDFMLNYQIKSVPCLLVIENATKSEEIYAFQSVTYMYQKLLPYIT